MKLDNKRIGDAIRTIRKCRGMTQVDLAKMVGMEPNSVAMLERGERGYNVENLNAFAIALRVPTSCLTVLGSEEPTDELGRKLVDRVRSMLTSILKTNFEP